MNRNKGMGEMGDVAIFTPAIAKGLIERGFKLIAQTEKAWYFEDSVLLWCAVDELMEQEQDKYK